MNERREIGCLASDDGSHPGKDGNRESAGAKKDIDDGKCHKKERMMLE